VTDFSFREKFGRLFCINAIEETKPRHCSGAKINLFRYCAELLLYYFLLGWLPAMLTTVISDKQRA
jgi:hypothetical protein